MTTETNNPGAALTIQPGRAQEATESEGPAPIELHSIPGRRAGMTVSIQDGVAVVEESENTPAGFARAVEKQTSWSRDPIKFYREGSDSQILARNASMHDTVDLGGLIGRTSLGAALHSGFLVENENGGFERAAEAKPPAPPRPPRTTWVGLRPVCQISYRHVAVPVEVPVVRLASHGAGQDLIALAVTPCPFKHSLRVALADHAGHRGAGLSDHGGGHVVDGGAGACEVGAERASDIAEDALGDLG
jgi:hypothetical protein